MIIKINVNNVLSAMKNSKMETKLKSFKTAIINIIMDVLTLGSKKKRDVLYAILA
jgi:hypothetical protein